MRMTKRVAPELKVGRFSFSGGGEAYVNGLTLARKSVAQLKYEDQNTSYGVELHGKNVRFNMSWAPVDLRLDWKPHVIKVDLNLKVGSWL
jgi:hypothetical protein